MSLATYIYYAVPGSKHAVNHSQRFFLLPLRLIMISASLLSQQRRVHRNTLPTGEHTYPTPIKLMADYTLYADATTHHMRKENYTEVREWCEFHLGKLDLHQRICGVHELPIVRKTSHNH